MPFLFSQVLARLTSEDLIMKLSIKHSLTALVLSSMALMSIQATGAEPDQAKKNIRNEVGIMLNILKASLKQQSSGKNIRFRAESVFYLAEQGVVFEIDSGNHGRSFFGFDGLLRNIPVAPVAPMVNSNGKRVEININQGEIEAMVERIIRHGGDYDDDMRDNIRDLSEEQRELAWEKREYERRKRDLEFEKRNASGERLKNIEQTLAELNGEVKTLTLKSAELDKHLTGLQTEHKKEIAARSAAQKKLYREALSIFEDTVGDMLCSYGAGLKSLPSDENITFVLSDFVEADEDSVINTHDKVYVFKQKDVKACVTGKANKEKLLTSANTYLF